MKHTIGVVTGTRAEFGLLLPLITKLENDEEIELRLVVTGSHLCSTFGNTQVEIEKAGFPIFAKIPIPLEGDTKVDMVKSLAEILSSMVEFLVKNPLELLIVLGDRYEIFGTSIVAAILGIPIVHLHGGETTEGAVDEFFRHSITKMSTLHFTASEQYRQRVIQLGESPSRVFNVGALGVENTKKISEIPMDCVQNVIGLNLTDSNYGLVIFHPVTKEENTAEQQVKELVCALDCFPKMKFIIIKSNADAGGRAINRLWELNSPRHQNWALIANLSMEYYLTALKHARVIIGNSSSGIIEAPSYQVPTINIGDRQKGRLMLPSVISCLPVKESIISAMNVALSVEFRSNMVNTVSPFDFGNTSEKIANEIKRFLKSDEKNIKKTFYDLEF